MSDTARITEKQQAFIEAQELFFVATAPLSGDGHVNVSPKGLAGMFAVIDETTVAYLDTWGTGIETTAHVKENARLCIMFCSFGPEPCILRLHGTGEVLERGHDAFDTLREHFPQIDGVRSIMRLHVSRVAKSCGFGVPRYTFEGHRDELTRFATEWGPEKVAAFTEKNNTTSIDGLPGIAT